MFKKYKKANNIISQKIFAINLYITKKRQNTYYNINNCNYFMYKKK